MSLGFSSGISRYADDMGTWTENEAEWYREAIKFLNTKELWQRLIDVHSCLGTDTLTPVTRGQEIGIIALAIAYGKEFTFYNHDSSDEFIIRMLKQWDTELGVPIQELYTPLERLRLGLDRPQAKSERIRMGY